MFPTQGRASSGTLKTVALCVCALILSAAPAAANGAMSLALGTFGWGAWFGYVLVIVLFEALLMGRWLRVSMGRAVTLSIGANFVTATLGGFVSGMASYGFLGVFGSRLNPNPFAQALLVFTLFAAASAPVEASIWRASLPSPGRRDGRGVLLLSLAAHLLGVPLGLAILLAPERPYRGLEMQVQGERHVWLGHAIRRALGDYIARHEALPPDRTYDELLERLRPQLGRFAGDPGLWAAAYRPNYQRFDTGEKRRGVPVEWNAGTAGEKLFDGPRRTVWLARSHGDGYCEGLVMELPGVRVERTIDPAKLGLTAGAAP